MKLTIPRTDLVKALSTVRSVVGGGSLPILGTVLISAKNNRLELTCTDLDISLRTHTAVTVKEEGGCCVNAGIFFGIVNALTGDDLSIEQSKDSLTIKAGSSKYKLGILEAGEFPPLPSLKKPVTFQLPQVKLRSVLADTAFCSSADGA